MNFMRTSASRTCICEYAMAKSYEALGAYAAAAQTSMHSKRTPTNLHEIAVT